MSTTDYVIDFRRATRALLAAGLTQYETECPDEYSVIAQAVQRGAFFTVEASLAPTGLDEIHIGLVGADGERINLISVENFENTCASIQ